jgi:membrane protease YdiL (CAAX protease family)
MSVAPHEEGAYYAGATRGRGMANQVKRHSLVTYFALAYGLSWLELWIASGLLHAPAVVAITLTTLAPTIAALIVTALAEGRPGLVNLGRRMLLWRVSGLWYLAALLLIPLAYVAGTLFISRGPAGFTPPASVVYWLISSIIATVLILVLGGPLFEEPGWRGFALPRLQHRFGPLGGTVILGFLWGCWHLPQYLIPEWAAQNGGLSVASVVTFLFLVLAFNVIMSWVWNGTRGSLLLAVLAHTGINATQAVVVEPLFPGFGGNEVGALIGFGGLAVLIVLLTRGNLGYAAAARSPSKQRR